ncbi:Mu transposase C-terminal domain-containing protein [Kitasatospora sp. NPDC059795]|uniref:Mu transposase C-terminal domain-containing protein n=1 Tax=Kitasatospora sp. NPDC059795 TaxID=3346949 RepID=UPI0036617C4B
MSAPAALPQQQRSFHVELSLGDRVRWRGRPHLVVEIAGTAVTLVVEGSPPGADDEATAGGDAGPGSEYTVVLAPYLLRSPGFEVLGRSARTESLLPLSRLQSVRPEVAARAREWEQHVVEVHTGLHPHAPAGSAPRPGYDPAHRTLAQRYEAKAAELQAMGWQGASAGTVERKRRAWLAQGLWGLVDDRSTRTRSELGRTDQRVVELLLTLVERARKRRESVGNAMRLYERLKAALNRQFPSLARELVPPVSSFYALLKRLGIRVKDLTAPRRRQDDEANRPEPPFATIVAQLPGERVEIDTTGLDIVARGEDGRPVSLELTIAIDVATRSILAGVVRPRYSSAYADSAAKDKGKGGRSGQRGRRRRRRGRATKGVDASLLLAQMLAPQIADRHWSPLALAENSDLPYAQMLEADPRMAGAAARPVIVPTMVVIDHGKVFTSQVFTDACAHLGITVRPARTRIPTDKAIVERTMAAIKSLFCQFVAGYTGSDISRRGKDVEKGRLWRLDEINDLLQQFISLHWQQRPHEGLRNPFHSAMPALTPNQAYAAHVAACGHLPLPLSDEDVLHLLPTAWARVTDKGIRLNRRTYDSARLGPLRGMPSGLWGPNRMRWEVRYHPYQPETVWLRDHRSDEWIPVDFIHKHLITDPWTEWLWEEATAAFLERGGAADDEEAIAREVSALRRRAARPPAVTDRQAPAPAEATVRVPDPNPVDRYANIPHIDPADVAARRTLDGDPAALFGAPPPDSAPTAVDTVPAGLGTVPIPRTPAAEPRALVARTLSDAAHTLFGGLRVRRSPATDTAKTE